MEVTSKHPKFKKRNTQIQPVYSRCLITRKLMLPITAIGSNIKEIIEQNIANLFEGKCLVEGYIKPSSSKVITYSSGTIERGIYIIFEVVFECDVCFPVEGTKILCVAKNITKAGIRAESADTSPSPIVVFIARDHHYSHQYYSTIQEGDKFEIRVIGQRFELNDKYVSVIGEVITPKADKDFSKYGKNKQDKSKEPMKPRIEF
jgi:DNA-directed RNA polymerase subunit E'/Rpb7